MTTTDNIDIEYGPATFQVERKGRMFLLYSTDGGERDHVASFFHDNKVRYVANAIENTYGAEVRFMEPEPPAPPAPVKKSGKDKDKGKGKGKKDAAPETEPVKKKMKTKTR